MENWNSYLTEPRKFSPADFAVPDPFYGPVYSWVWNAPVDEQIIRNQRQSWAMSILNPSIMLS